jgi:hypothetical protein
MNGLNKLECYNTVEKRAASDKYSSSMGRLLAPRKMEGRKEGSVTNMDAMKLFFHHR